MEEQMQSNFNFDSHSSTNQDLTIVFTPDESVKHYSYSLFNENELIDSNIIEKNEPVSIVLTETGIYQIKINTYDAENKKNVIESGIYEIDKEAPIIELSNEVLKLRAGEEFSLKDGVKAYDSQDGDLLDKITTNIAELDLNETGIKKLIYKVEDNAGNVTEKTFTWKDGNLGDKDNPGGNGGNSGDNNNPGGKGGNTGDNNNPGGNGSNSGNSGNLGNNGGSGTNGSLGNSSGLGSSSSKSQMQSSNIKDSTMTNYTLPKTGTNMYIIIGVICAIVFGIFSIIKYRKLREIK